MKNKRFTAGPLEEPTKVVATEEAPREEPKEVEAPVEETKEPEVEEVEAIIDGVQMSLNIRKKPEVKANNQIAVLGKGTKIIVVEPRKPVKDSEGREWYKVRIKKDAKKDDPIYNGYAMKKYIKIL